MQVTAEAMLALIEELAKMTGEAILTHDGRKRFGKHSWRSTGAVFMTSIGIEIFKVQLMGKWACAAVTHYTRLVPLKATTEDFRKALAGERANMAKGQSAQKIKRIKRALEIGKAVGYGAHLHPNAKPMRKSAA